MTATLRLTTDLHDRLVAMATSPVETGAVLMASLVPTDHDRSALLGLDLLEVPDEAYEVRTDQSLQVTSDGYVHALKTAAARGAMAIWVHSHPGNHAIPRPSRHDMKVNEQLEQLFGDRTGSGQYGHLIVSHRDGALTFTGAITGPVNGPIDRLSVVGEHWSFRSDFDTPQSEHLELFDRNIRAFGTGIQSAISLLTIAVVGAGGTGSATAEQLVRLGVRSFILVDPDTLSASNVTRVYGSSPTDVGRAKVDVLGDHLERIAVGVRAERIQGSIVDEQTARALVGADVVFGCTDDNAGRLRLSRLPYYYLIPVIDCGIQIHADANGVINGIFGRVTTLHHGASCLICRDRIDLRLADAEVRSSEQQEQLEKEGYAPALPGVEPSVVPFTTLVASTAVSEFLERLVGYGDTPSPTELILFIHDRGVRGNCEEPQPGHYCDPASGKTGSDHNMFLGLNWAS